jgi:MoaA/NifB/PqqE/SkfB family radical SAM enzyme
MRSQYFKIFSLMFKKGRKTWALSQALKYVLLPLERLMGSSIRGPVLGTFFVTYRCTNKCRMCSFWTKTQLKEQPEMETGEMLQILEDFKHIGTSGIGFTGGEPLLRHDIFVLLSASSSLGFVTHLNTNGFLLDHEKVQGIFESRVDSVNISLDSENSVFHNTIRGRDNCFERAIDGITLLLNKRKESHKKAPRINIVSVLGQWNRKEIPGLVSLARKTGVDSIGFIPCHNFKQQESGAEESNELKLMELDRTIDYLIYEKKRTDFIDNSYTYLRLFKYFFREIPLPMLCHASYLSIGVDCYGDIFPCFPWIEMNKPVANIKKIPLRKFWRSQLLREKRKEIDHCRECYWNCHTEMNLLFSPFLSMILKHEKFNRAK